MKIMKPAKFLTCNVLLLMSLRVSPAIAQAVNDASGAASNKQIAHNGQPSATQALDPPPVERLLGNWDNRNPGFGRRASICSSTRSPSSRATSAAG